MYSNIQCTLVIFKLEFFYLNFIWIFLFEFYLYFFIWIWEALMSQLVLTFSCAINFPLLFLVFFMKFRLVCRSFNLILYHQFTEKFIIHFVGFNLLIVWSFLLRVFGRRTRVFPPVRIVSKTLLGENSSWNDPPRYIPPRNVPPQRCPGLWLRCFSL